MTGHGNEAEVLVSFYRPSSLAKNADPCPFACCPKTVLARLRLSRRKKHRVQRPDMRHRYPLTTDSDVKFVHEDVANSLGEKCQKLACGEKARMGQRRVQPYITITFTITITTTITVTATITTTNTITITTGLAKLPLARSRLPR